MPVTQRPRMDKHVSHAPSSGRRAGPVGLTYDLRFSKVAQ
jgi:hypothetical protein